MYSQFMIKINMKQNPNAKKGFTLIELLVALVILGIVVAVGVQEFVQVIVAVVLLGLRAGLFILMTIMLIPPLLKQVKSLELRIIQQSIRQLLEAQRLYLMPLGKVTIRLMLFSQLPKQALR
ncbi:MAG: prepilin-type N-terminal cleavage/methylation domain-containing protein [Cellvibrionaceae bacterium]|jgi:prepilin-type N-terminal cleavage/methylation domain-containing protein